MNPPLLGLEILLSVSLSYSLTVCADLNLWLGNSVNSVQYLEKVKNTFIYRQTDRYIHTHTSFSSRSSTTAARLLPGLIAQNGTSPKAKPEKKCRMLFNIP